MDTTRETLTIIETAQVLGVGRSTAYELARTGQIPILRLGRRLLVPRVALQRLLAGETTQNGHEDRSWTPKEPDSSPFETQKGPDRRETVVDVSER